jgi:hypothetical protein
MKSARLTAALVAITSLLSATAETPKVILGRAEFTEYQPGALPLIISAPHGGTLRPADLPNRSFGVIAQDSYTQELARLLQAEIAARYGAPPHLIICRLHRMKLDANREINEAAQGNDRAVAAWQDFQSFIKQARQTVQTHFGYGLYIDLHGHRHPENRVELGYLLTAEQLRATNAHLDSDSAILNQTSLRDLAMRTQVPFSALLRGPSSLGALLEKHGYPSVPSPTFHAPLPKEQYYSGGHNTAQHGSLNGGAISGLQIECPWKGVRDKPEHARAFAKALSIALGDYWLAHFQTELKAKAP